MLTQDQIQLISDEYNAGFTFAHLTPRGYVDAFVDVCEAGVSVTISYEGEGRETFCREAMRSAIDWLGRGFVDVDGAMLEEQDEHVTAYCIWAVESDEEIARLIDSVRLTGRFAQ